jgi:hypothetical protein
MSALEDRRQAAREAYHDATDPPEKFSDRGLADAIETATRVRITPEIIEAAYPVLGRYLTVEQRLTAAFEAAGFEVEQ